MGSKRKRDDDDSSNDELDRKERKRQKKEAKRLKKEAKKLKRKSKDKSSSSSEKRRERQGSDTDQPDAAPSPPSTKQKEQQHLPTVLRRKRLEVTISLLPSCLGNVEKSVNESLSLLLLKYTDGVDGILLAFDDVEILRHGHGSILDDLPYVHYQVTCRALVFCPTVGSHLTGVVTESFHSHLSLVVNYYFNASVPASKLRAAGFDFDTSREQWYVSQDGVNSMISIGQRVEFVVDKVHESGGIISLDGSSPLLKEAVR